MFEAYHQSIIIANPHLHQSIKTELLANKTVVFNQEVLSVEQYLNNLSLKKLNTQELYFKLALKLKSLSNELVYFKENVTSSGFIKELLNFIDLMNLFEIELSDLPKDHVYHEELIKIIETTKFKTNSSYHLNIINQLNDFSNVLIIDDLYDFKTQHLIDLMLEKGATLFKRTSYLPKTNLTSYINSAQEIEGLCQHLNRDYPQQPISIVCLNDKDLRMLQMYLKRYNLAFNSNLTNPNNNIFKRSYYLMQYSLNPNDANALQVIGFNPINHDDFKAYQSILNDFNLNYNDDLSYLLDIDFNHNYFNNIQIESIKTNVIKAIEVQKALNEFLESYHNLDLVTLFQQVYTYMYTNYKNKEQLAALKAYLELAHRYYEGLPELVIEGLLELSTSNKIEYLDAAITLTSLNKLPLTSDKLYFINSTTKHYPNFKSFKGVFDERYTSLIKQIPSSSIRFNQHMDNLNRILNYYPNLSFSFPLSSYDGKGLEAALEVEAIAGKAKIGINIRSNQGYLNSQKINSDLAKALYLKDNSLRASISALQTYSNCPLAYYLNYGLKIRKQSTNGFQSNTIGTINHQVLEYLLNTNNLDEFKLVDVESMIGQILNEFKAIYPNNAKRLAMIETRLNRGFALNESFINSITTNSKLKPTYSEYLLEKDYLLSNELTLKFKAYVDRIDLNKDRCMIYDYKSSQKNIKFDDILTGRNLQLVTYASMIEDLFNQRCLGAAYINLGNTHLSTDTTKLKRSTEELIDLLTDDEHLGSLQAKVKAINGIFFKDEANLLSSENIIYSNIKALVDKALGKDSEPVASFKKVYDLEALKKLLLSVYSNLTSDLIGGNISISKDKQNCQYCDYHAICRANLGDVRKAEPWVKDIDENNYLTKGAKTKGEEDE